MTFRKKVACRLLAICTMLTALPLGCVSNSAAAPAETNLVAGLPYTVQTGVGIAHSYGLSGTESDPADGKLTDGKRAATLSYGDEAWHKCYRGYTRSITFELPETKAVTGFSVSLIQRASAGLPLPPSFDLYVSENGEDYMLAHSHDTTALQGVNVDTKRDIRALGVGRFRAKFVRITFRCEVNVFLDEIEVYGGALDGTEAPFVKAEPAPEVGAYDAGVEGCREMVLLYCGYKGEYTEEYVNNSEEKLLPYFAYVGTDGKIKDDFFDSFLFSALRGACPSGGSLDPSRKAQATLEDWEFYLNSIFDETYNCGAIERIMERVKQETGKTDATVSLVINVPYPHIGDKPFGDINGDGKAEYCRNSQDQLAIYDWFFRRVEQTMEARSYQNIRFGGYYWGTEGISPEDEREDGALIRAFADLVHAHGTKLFWIPYLYGNGFDRTEELGFDCAMMQPNFSFLDYAEEACFTEIDREIRKYGLGIEIEVKWSALDDPQYLQRYYTYLNAGYALGFEQNTAHSYYQNAAPGTFYHFSRSSDKNLRNAYDDTYAFVKRVYQPRQIHLETRVKPIRQGSIATGFIRTAEGVNGASLGCWSWQITEQPAHGKVAVGKDGTFTYKPEKDFVGTDSFSVCMQAEYASSEVLTVEIEVQGDPDTSAPAESTTETEAVSETGSASTPTEKKNPLAVPLAIAGGALVALAAGVATVLHLKKKKR